jgi:hypothetical protein
MMSIARGLWNDESGVVVSAELATVATVGVLGLTAGLGVAASATNDELIELGKAIRSLDQSYEVQGRTTCCGFSATSRFTQTPVVESIAELCAGPLPGKQSTVVESVPTAPVIPAEAAPTTIEVPIQAIPNGRIESTPVSPAETILQGQ